jgi:small-conductance mechanosensitive channel
MESMGEFWNRSAAVLNARIAGSEFTPLGILTVVVLTAALVWSTRRGTRWLVDSVLARRGFDVNLREAIGTILRYVIVTLGVLVILQGAGIDLTSLNVLVGAVGVGLGFGLQNITSNFFSGLIILFERPIRRGDRVEIAGMVGEVREIGARATTLVNDENVAIVVPNSQFVSERVINWSRPGQLTAYILPIHVAHSTDPHLVRQILLRAAAAHHDVLDEPPAEVEFAEAGLWALRFQLQVWSTEHLKRAGTLKSDLNFAIWQELTAAGVTILPPAGPLAAGLHLGNPDEATRR